jgi:hypothetical protein
VTDLVEQLARLSDDELREVTRQTGAVRRRRMHTVLREIRTTLLPEFSDRKAARALANAASGRRDGGDLDLCATIEQRLIVALGHLDDVPGADRIRQLISG